MIGAGALAAGLTVGAAPGRALEEGGTPAASVTPSSLTFDARVGTTSASQRVTVNSTGDGALYVYFTDLEGNSPDQFRITDQTCGYYVGEAGDGCTVDVAFSPTSRGRKTAELEIYDNAGDSPQHVDLVGNPDQPCFEGTDAETSGNGQQPIQTASCTGQTFDQPVGTTFNTISSIIKWGDGTQSAGQTIVGGPGELDVYGTHDYQDDLTTFDGCGEVYDVTTIINPGQPGSQKVTSEVFTGDEPC